MKNKISNYIFPALICIAVLAVVFSQQKEQDAFRQGKENPLYRNLMEHNVYIRRGFDKAYITWMITGS